MKRRSIWKNLGYALAATPMAYAAGLIISTLAGALDDAIFKLQYGGYWWLLLIGTYVLLFIYFTQEEQIRKNRKRKKVVSALILYWKEQLVKQGKPQPSDSEVKCVEDMLTERLKISAFFDPLLWDRYFPDEEYSKYLFGIVDNFIMNWGRKKEKYEKS